MAPHEPGDARRHARREAGGAARSRGRSQSRRHHQRAERGRHRRTSWSSTTSCAAWATSPCASTRRSPWMRRRPTEDLDALDELRERFGDDPLLKTGAVKMMADGVVETRTAAMLAPYEGTQRRAATARLTPEDMTRLVAELDRPRLAGDDACRRRRRGSRDAGCLRKRAEVEPRAGRRAPPSDRAPRIAGPRGRPAFRDAGRGRQRAARARHCRPNPRDPWAAQPRARTCRTRLDVRQPGEGRRASGVRVGLAGGAAGPAARHLRRREPHRLRRRARRRLDARGESDARRRHSRVHERSGLGVLRRSAQGHARARHAGRHRHPLGGPVCPATRTAAGGRGRDDDRGRQDRLPARPGSRPTTSDPADAAAPAAERRPRRSVSSLPQSSHAHRGLGVARGPAAGQRLPAGAAAATWTSSWSGSWRAATRTGRSFSNTSWTSGRRSTSPAPEGRGSTDSAATTRGSCRRASSSAARSGPTA